MSSLPESVGKLTGKVVLVVWGRGNSPESLQKINDELNKREASRIVLENSERLTLSNHPISGFDVVLSNLLDPHPLEHTFELFSEFVRILKPNGKIIGREREDCNADRTQSNLRLAGFVNISGKTDSSQYFSADKPAFEIGASSKLSFGKPAVWSLSNNLVDDDIELVDEDDLLDDDDLLKPNAESLKVCGTTGKRKACKDCSCGLAEELDAENGKTTVSTKSVTSSCGSCYLGDAFRCASCPYLGMPAFKPGEKIQLSERQLNADN